MRRGRFAIAAVAGVSLGLIFAGSALACTCANRDPAKALAKSDAAVIGRLLKVEPTGVEFSGAEEARFEYRILRVYRGKKFRAGKTLILQSWLSGAACGLPQGVGRHYGLFLWWGGAEWRSSSCSVISPPDMRSAAQEPAWAGASGTAGNTCAV